MGKCLDFILVLMKEVLCFSFDMVKCLTCANIFFQCLTPSLMDLACSSHRAKLFIYNELDNHFVHRFDTFLFLVSEKLNCWKVEFM